MLSVSFATGILVGSVPFILPLSLQILFFLIDSHRFGYVSMHQMLIGNSIFKINESTISWTSFVLLLFSL